MLTAERIDELVQLDRGRTHVAIYTDDEIFQEEMKRIFYTTWVFVGHVSEIPHPGDYKTSYIGQIPVILSRDEQGQVHVLVNRCSHRGTTVCQREYGNANYFRCEYHGWVFGCDGALAGVSLRRGFGPGEIEESELGLDRVPRVDTYRGLIFASFAESGPSLSEQLGLSKRYLDDWADQSPTGEIQITGGVWKHTYEGNWKLQLEGSNEGYHPDYLHQIAGEIRQYIAEHGGNPGLQGARRRGRGLGFGASNVLGIDLGNGHSIMESPRSDDPDAWRQQYPPAYVEALEERHGPERTKRILGEGWRMQLFPNAAFANTNLRVIRPISVDRTEVRQYHVALPEIEGVTDQLNITRLKGHQGFYGPSGYGSPDDLECFERMQEGYKTRALDTLNPWILLNRGLSIEQRGPNGERIGHVSTEVEQRAIYYAWTALMKGQSHVVAGDAAGAAGGR
jgi:phenylpropionate dioxygenase-like ring-hydroxylating dioxygenase large terminal subunit